MLNNLTEMAARVLEGKIVLITGATGTIGAALTTRLLKFNPAAIRLLDHNEEKTFFTNLRYGKDNRVRSLLGDIRDRERMQRALQNVDIVFHCAALKHVGIS